MKKTKGKTTTAPKKGVRKFPYQLEYCPNRDCIQIHARSRFPSGDVMDSTDLRFNSKPGRARKRHPLFTALSKINGLQSASGGGYFLQVLKANSMFTWDKLLPKILEAVQKTVAGKRQMSQVGEPKRPSETELSSLRAQGCDV